MSNPKFKFNCGGRVPSRQYIGIVGKVLGRNATGIDNFEQKENMEIEKTEFQKYIEKNEMAKSMGREVLQAFSRFKLLAENESPVVVVIPDGCQEHVDLLVEKRDEFGRYYKIDEWKDLVKYSKVALRVYVF